MIYCKFWELDTDHDFLIDKENLIRYGNHALTYRIVDRIFSQVCFILKLLLFSEHINVLYSLLMYVSRLSTSLMLRGKWLCCKILVSNFTCAGWTSFWQQLCTSIPSCLSCLYMSQYKSLCRCQESLPARLKEKWGMKILFILYCRRRINHLILVLSTGMYFNWCSLTQGLASILSAISSMQCIAAV